MKNCFKNKKVLVTGGYGSIGRALARELLNQGADVVRLLDIDETRGFELQHEIKDKRLRFLMGDVRDKQRLSYALEDIDIVFHAAAMKHVEACEYNPFEAVKTNVIGTQNVIDAAIEKDVEKVIFTSSDKAVNPTNVMGATKLLCERLITAANYYKGKRKAIFSSVRFGNVIGSRGSVIPLFLNQLKRGDPLTVTNLNMTRFIMTMDRATELLFKTAQLMKGGEIFVFKMSAVRIRDLAEAVIQKFGSERGPRPRIKVMGNKPGEKMYEELMTAEEAKRALETDEMYIILPEMKGLSFINRRRYLSGKNYGDTRKTEVKSYRSDETELLTKEEIIKILDECIK